MLGYRYESAQFVIQDRLRDVARQHLAHLSAEGRRVEARRPVPQQRYDVRAALEHARSLAHPATLRPHHLFR